MNKFTTHLKKEADHIRLTSAERQLLRARLLEAQSLRLAPPQPILSPYRRFLVPRLLALYSFIGIIAIGSGTVSAAQGALPGDILYPIKVNVTEPVEAALASSPRAKAEVNAQFAERRVHEIEKLAERGTLDEATAAQVAQDFDYYAAQVERHSKESGREDDRAFITEVADSLTQVANSLAEEDDSNDASSATLEQKSELRSDERSNNEQDKDERTRKSSKDFADHVRARAWSMKHSESDDANDRDDNRGNDENRSGSGNDEDNGDVSGGNSGSGDVSTSGNTGGGDDGNTSGSGSTSADGDRSGSGSDDGNGGGDRDGDGGGDSDDSSSGRGSGDDSDDRDDD